MVLPKVKGHLRAIPISSSDTFLKCIGYPFLRIFIELVVFEIVIDRHVFEAASHVTRDMPNAYRTPADCVRSGFPLTLGMRAACRLGIRTDDSPERGYLRADCTWDSGTSTAFRRTRSL
jgi:hypothetical protein